MRKIFFRTLMVLLGLFFLLNGVNACINDGYTLINEQNWSENYKEILLTGIASIITIMGIYLVFLLKTINKYKKNNKFTTSDIYNTIYKIIGVFIATLLIVFPFVGLGSMILMMIFVIFLLYYIAQSIKDLNNKKLVIFVLMILLFIPINILLIYLFDLFNIDGSIIEFSMSIGNIIYGYIFLLIPFFGTKNIRLKTLGISTIAVLTIMLSSDISLFIIMLISSI